MQKSFFRQHSLRFVAVVLAVGLTLAATQANAALTWNGSVDTDFNNTANWGGSINTGLNFGTTAVAGGTTTLSANATCVAISLLGNAPNAVTINTNGKVLTMGQASAGTASLIITQNTVSGPAYLTIAGGIALNRTYQNLRVNSQTGATLELNNAIGTAMGTHGLNSIGVGTMILSGTNTFSGDGTSTPGVAGEGGIIDQSGGGTTTITGTANFNSTAYVRVTGVSGTPSTLNLNSANALNGSPTLIVNSFGYLNNTSGAAITLAGNPKLSLIGNMTFGSGSGTDANSLNMGTGTVDGGGVARTITVNTDNVDATADTVLELDGQLTNFTSLNKNGRGTLVLGGSASNTTGDVTLNGAGSLARANKLVLAKTGGAIAISGNLTLNTPSNSNVARVYLQGDEQIASTGILTFDIQGTSNSSPQFFLQGHTQTLGGIQDTINPSATARGLINNTNDETGVGNGKLILDVAGATTYTFGNNDGALQNAFGGGSGILSLEKKGAGTQVLVGSEITYTGGTTLHTGTLALKGANAFGSVVNFDSGSTGVLEIQSNSRVRGLSTAAGFTSATVQNAVGADPTLIVNQTSNLTFDGVLQDNPGGNTLALTKNNTGALVLTAASTYTGVTTVGGGILEIGTNGDIHDSSVIKVANLATYQVDVGAEALSTRDVRSQMTGGDSLQGQTGGLKAWIHQDANATAQSVTMAWRERSGAPELALLASNVLTYTQPTTPSYYVLAMQYDDTMVLGGETMANIAWNNGGTWTLLGTNLETAQGDMNMWGDYLIDQDNNTVYVVTNHNASAGAEFAVIPEPGTLVLLATGLLGLIAYAWRKRK